MQFEDKLYMEFFNNWNKFVQQNENLKKNDLKNLPIIKFQTEMEKSMKVFNI